MRFVDGKQSNRQRCQHAGEPFALEAFGFDVDEPKLATRHCGDTRVDLGWTERGIDERGSDPFLGERVYLVFHQRD
jgi:hypothetical protein